MTQLRSLRLAIPAALLALATSAVPAMALEPSVFVAEHPDSWSGTLTDVAWRGSTVVATADLEVGGVPLVGIYRSTNRGEAGSWVADQITSSLIPRLESSAAVCDGRAVAAHVIRMDSATRGILTATRSLTSPVEGQREWTTVNVIARKPDVACVANKELAVAWFEKISSGYKVVLETGVVAGDDLSPQRFSLGTGTPGRGLSVAATADRVYVAWFSGNTLKLRRYRIGSTSARTLTALGTTTVGTFRGGTTPRIGADGDRVVLAYTHGADLKVRRSTNKGVSFSSARTVRNLPDASEVGAIATGVTVKGKRVALGVIDVGGLETLSGTGRGYKSTNGGASFTRLTTHSGGSVLTTFVRVGSSDRWAELWDHSLDGGGSPGQIRFRRE